MKVTRENIQHLPKDILNMISETLGVTQMEKDLEMVKADWKQLEFVENQTDEICMAAVTQDGWALQFVKDKTEEICNVAVNNEQIAIQFAPFRLSTFAVAKASTSPNTQYIHEMAIENRLFRSRGSFELEFNGLSTYRNYPWLEPINKRTTRTVSQIYDAFCLHDRHSVEGYNRFSRMCRHNLLWKDKDLYVRVADLYVAAECLSHLTATTLQLGTEHIAQLREDFTEEFGEKTEIEA